MNTKVWYKSKTIWVNLIVLLIVIAGALYPPVLTFVESNPLFALIGIPALNLALRSITSDAVTLTSDDILSALPKDSTASK